MAEFLIQLTTKLENTKFAVNYDDIVLIEDGKVVLKSSGTIEVLESYDKIKKLLGIAGIMVIS